MHDLKEATVNTIYEVLSGSHAYGLATDQADEDIRGIFLPTGEELLGFGYEETKTMPPDQVYHCLRKYLALALRANPSMLAWLWVGNGYVLKSSPWSDELRANRHRFLSKLVYKTFGGYATGQLKKMEQSYGESRGYALHGERDATGDPYSVEAGYDAKNAMHLIRILRCGCDLLETGEYGLYRQHDREELLSIRYGEWQMHEVISEANRLFKAMDKSLEMTLLPEKPDSDWVTGFLIRAHQSSIADRGTQPTTPPPPPAPPRPPLP
jgi:predicted nucleotidyltransferase